MTHAYLGLAALDVLVTAVGYSLLACLGFVRGLRDSLPWLGLAFLAGWATTGVVLSFGVTVGLDPDLVQVFVVVAALIGGLAAARRLFPGVPCVVAPRERSVLARATAFSGAGLVLMALLVALDEATKMSADMSSDVWEFWLPKAKAIYYFHGLDTGLGGYTTYANYEYPPLPPVMNAVTFHFMGGVEPVLLPLQMCLLFVAFVASVAVLLRRVPGWILWPSLALLVLAPQVWARMFNVQPDQLLAYLLAVAAVAGILWLEEPRRAWLALSGVFLATAALTKAEGVLLAFLLAAVIIGAGLARRGRPALAGLVLLLGPLAIAPWKLWLSQHHQPVSATVYHWTDLLHPVYLADRVDRLSYAVGQMTDMLVDSARWSPILPLALGAAIVLAPTLRELSALLGAWIVVAFFGLASVYWTSKLDLEWYVSTSASRVVSTLPIVAGAVLPLLLGIALERERSQQRARREQEGLVVVPPGAPVGTTAEALR